MNDLSPHAKAIAEILTRCKETVAVAESSAGGLISAALLAVPGASAYFTGGAVAYTRQSREAFLQVPASALAGITPSTEAYALLLARTVRERLSATWGLAETGTAGPAGSRYGYNAGRTCVAIAGPMEKTLVIETGHGDRTANMQAFADAALDLMARALTESA
ncbi:MAG: CinA family protein [Betaproteobacteria bacterium]|nr:CinA family protein [Betaproteobacteria bacterium]